MDHYSVVGWMDECFFRPLLCTIKAKLGRGQPGLLRWSWDETLPQCSIDRSTLHTAAYHATSELAVAPQCGGGCGPVHKPLAYHAGAQHSFPCGDNAVAQMAEQTSNKGCTNVCIKSGTSKWTFHEPQKLWQDNRFASQSPTQMAAHGELTSSHQITEVNLCVEALGKTSHTIPPLFTQLWWVPGGTKTGKIVNGITVTAENVLNSPQRRWDHKREFQYQGVNLKSAELTGISDYKPLHLHLH